MTESVNYRRRRESNWLAAVALAITDAQRLAAEQAAGVGGAAPAALVALTEFDDEAIGSHAARLGLTDSGAVRLFDRLTAEGLVRRTAGRDGRTLAVRLTAKGRRTAERIVQARAAAVEEILAALDDAQRHQLAELSRKLLGSLRHVGFDARSVCRLCDYQVCHSAGVCPV
jgi:MarR family transcriptional regulator, negative regulator of the multidrug operon emrRAB